MRTIIVAVGFVCALGVPATAQPKGDIGKRVDTYLRRGIGFYAQKQYELAIIEFRAGYALDPRPDFLFALAQAERLSGDCPSATVYYKRFLTTKPGINQAEAARVNMRRCARALESGPQVKKAPMLTSEALKSAEQASAPAASPIAPRPVTVDAAGAVSPVKPWYRDRINVSLLAGAGASVVVAGGFWLAKSSAESSAVRASDDVKYRADLASAARNRTISVVGAGVGAVLSAALVYRVVSKRDGDERRPVVVAAPISGGAAFSVTGQF